MDKRSNAPISIFSDIDNLEITEIVALTFFRISQKSINKAIQHSGASEILVRVTEYPDSLKLTITDDGKGNAGSLDSALFVEKGHIGLSGMKK